MNYRSHLSVCLMMATLVSAGPAYAGPRTGGTRPKLDPTLWQADAPGRARDTVRVIVRTRPGQTSALRERLAQHGDAVRSESPALDTLSVSLHAEDLQALEIDDAVAHVSPDAVVQSTLSSGDATAAGSIENTLLPTLGLTTAKLTGRGVGVAVLDSGLAPGADVAPVAFYDFTRDGGLTAPYDDFGHGTHVSGLIAGTGRGSARARFGGISPGVRLFSLKVLDGRGEGLTSTVISALEFVMANRHRLGIDVVNLSLGHAITESANDDPLVQAVERAVQAGLVVVVAAGNAGRNPETGLPGYGGITSPGNALSAITVGAIDTRDTVTRGDDGIPVYSSRGPTRFDGFGKPDVVAPGHELVSSAAIASALYERYPERRVADAAGRPGFFRLSGTSMATAVTTGVVALLVEQNRRISNRPLPVNVIKAVLQFTALPVDGIDALAQGAGALNARGALALAGSLDVSAARGDWWSTAPVATTTTIGNESYVWNQTVIWGHTVVWGHSVFVHEDAWVPGTVWGSTVVWGHALVP